MWRRFLCRAFGHEWVFYRGREGGTLVAFCTACEIWRFA
jgi:hypothetical protein